MCKRNRLRTSYDTKEPETFYSNGGGEGVRGGGGGGGGELPPPALCNPGSHLLFSWLPSLYPFFFRLQNIDHCCVISPISNTRNGLILEIRESTVGYPWFRLRRGGGGEAWGTWCRGPSLPPPHLAFLAPFFLHWFFTPRAFAIAKYWALHCWVISPISLASHPLRVPSSRPSLSHLSLYFSPGLPQPFTSPV